jgi:dienelactone hydrolase
MSATRRVEVHRPGVTLAATLTTPDLPGPHPLVVFVHGLGSSKESPRNVVIAERLVEAGIASLLFDLSSHGESSPDLSDGIDAYISDLAAVFDWAAQERGLDRNRIGVAGSSLGAVVAVRALEERQVRPATMVLRAPPLEAHEFRAVTVPSLVLIGSRDPLRSQVEPGAEEQPGIRLRVIEGASHLFEEPGTLEEATQQTVEWFEATLLLRTPS